MPTAKTKKPTATKSKRSSSNGHAAAESNSQLQKLFHDALKDIGEGIAQNEQGRNHTGTKGCN
jgi:hypothetical protein